LRPRERLVAAGDTQLYLREWGERGPPIVFWHALGDHTSLQMTEAGPVLAGEFGYRVTGVDAPGFGGSPRVADERYQLPALAELVRELLDSLGLERAVFAGSSWGAGLGVHLAAAHPERVTALVLVDGGYLDPVNAHGDTLEELREHWRSQPGFRYGSWDELLHDTRGFVSRWSPELEEYVKSAYREEGGEVVSIMEPDVYAAAIHGVDRFPPSTAAARLGRSGVPVLVLAATEPPTNEERREASIAYFSAKVPQADIRRVEGAPHLMLEELPEQTASTIGAWLRSLELD
jgi:pimeloyl-ACP methyl ester carboxylesterase